MYFPCGRISCKDVLCLNTRDIYITLETQKLILVTVILRINREISLVFYDHLEGWDREGGREMQGRGYGDICMHMADSLCRAAEASITL